MSKFVVTVDTWEFRAALASVLPHLDSSADPDPLLSRIRAYVTPDGLVVVATDRSTVAMATSTLVEGNGELGCCSTDFAGLMLPHRLSDSQVGMWRASLEHLPELTRQVSMVHPILPEVRAHRDATEVQDLTDLIPMTDKDGDDAS